MDEGIFNEKKSSLEEKIGNYEKDGKRKLAADAYFEQADLFLNFYGKEDDLFREDIGNLLYKAALRYKMSDNMESFEAVQKYITYHDLYNANSKIQWIFEIWAYDSKPIANLDSIELPFGHSDSISSTTESSITKLTEKSQEYVNLIEEKIEQLIKDEEEEKISRKEIITLFYDYFQDVLKKIVIFSEDNKEESYLTQIKVFASNLANKILLRCLLNQNIEVGTKLIDKSIHAGISIQESYQEKLTGLKTIINQFETGKKAALWLPLSDLELIPTLDDRVIKIMNNGYSLNIREEITLTLQKLFRLNLIRGLEQVDLQDVFNETSLTPLNIIVDLYSQFPNDLFVIKFSGEIEGFAVIPTGDISEVQVVHLQTYLYEEVD